MLKECNIPILVTYVKITRENSSAYLKRGEKCYLIQYYYLIIK